MANSGKLVGSVLLGAAVGAVLGILFAPDKGTETRKKILNGAKDLVDDLKEKVKEGTDKLKDMGNMTEDKIDDFTKNATQKVDSQSKSVSDKKTDFA